MISYSDYSHKLSNLGVDDLVKKSFAAQKILKIFGNVEKYCYICYVTY